MKGCVTLIVVIDAVEFEYPTRTLDHLKKSVSDIHQQSLRKFPNFIQDEEQLEKLEGQVNEAMSFFHVCKILLWLISSLTLKWRFFLGMRNTSKVCQCIHFGLFSVYYSLQLTVQRLLNKSRPQRLIKMVHQSAELIILNFPHFYHSSQKILQQLK